MSAASRSVQATPNTVQAGVAFAAILLTAALVVILLAVARPAASDTQSAPGAGSAPAMHDRGWATAGEPAAAAPILHDRGSSSAAIAAVQGAPATAPILHDRGSSSAAIAAGAAATTQSTGVSSAAGADSAGPDGARRHR